MRICSLNKNKTDRCHLCLSVDMKIVFVCLGNICRSPMAECIMLDLLKRRGVNGGIEVISRATSNEEEGNPIYPPAQRKLREKGVEVLRRGATKLSKYDGDSADMILAMEERNIIGIRRIVGEDNMYKVKRLLDYTDNPHDIADPWWTGDFECTYQDILKGCNALIDNLTR